MKRLKAQRLVLICSIVFSILAAALYVNYRFISRFVLSQVPPWIPTGRLEYHVSTYQEFGASGHEATFSVISLSQETARAIESLGSDYFTKARTSWNSDPNKEYDQDMTVWEPTPIVPSEELGRSEVSGGLGVYDFLCRYQTCVNVANRHRVSFEETVNNPGSFYSHRGALYLVVNPTTLTIYTILGRGIE